MTKKEKRAPGSEEEYQRLYDQSERKVDGAVWDRNPIKQYVRRFGWLAVIQDYVERRQAAGIARPLEYLTIPGPNASDVGFLWKAGLIEKANDGFRNLVICDKENADKASKVLGTVRGVSRQSFDIAMRHDELPACFPFDVINLDFCNCVITGSARRKHALRTLIGIRRVFFLQRGQGFLLLLTTSTEDRSAKIYLEEALSNNFCEDGFRDAYLNQYGTLDSSPFQNNYRTFLGLVLPKAIGRMAKSRGYRIVEHFAAKYDSVRSGFHMLCHSFELEPLGQREPVKKYETRFRNTTWDELNTELSVRVENLANDAYVDFIPTLVQRDLLDIENILRSEPELEAELEAEAESLIGWWEPNGQG